MDYRGMAIDAGAVTEEEISQLEKSLFWEVMEEMRQQQEEEDQLRELLDSARLNPVIYITPGIIEKTPDTKGS